MLAPRYEGPAKVDLAGFSVYNQSMAKKQKIGRPDPVYRPFDPSLPTAVIFDMDGTLALLGGRNPYNAKTCDQDPVHAPVMRMADILRSHFTILVVSGRDSEFRPQTERWLADKAVQYERLFMRQAGDKRNDAIVKAEIFRDEIAPFYNIFAAFDDRQRVVDMWRWLGIPTFQVQEGNF